MRLSIFRLVLFVLTLLLSQNTIAQTPNNYLSLGYFAPYGFHVGAKLGVSFTLKDWEQDSENISIKSTRFSINPSLGYFTYPDVQHNVLINNEFVLSRHKPNKRFFPLTSIGTGYLIAQQKIDGAVNLATGDITTNSETLHYFLPTFNLGFGIAPKKNIGFYLKGFYGHKLSFNSINETFLGIDLGLLFNLSE